MILNIATELFFLEAVPVGLILLTLEILFYKVLTLQEEYAFNFSPIDSL